MTPSQVFHACLLPLYLWLATIQADSATEEARALIEKAIRAHGGKTRLQSITNVTTHTRGKLLKDGRSAAYTALRRVELPSRMRLELSLEGEPASKTRVIVVNGTVGWTKIGGGAAVRLKAEDVAEIRRGLYVEYISRSLSVLDDKQVTLKPLAEVSVGRDTLVGVAVSSEGRQTVELYFDKQSGLLSKQVTGRDDKGRLQEERYLEYKDFNGLKFPMRWVSYSGKEKTREVQLIDIVFHKEETASAFQAP